MGGICGFTGADEKSLLKSMCNSVVRGRERAEYYVDDNILLAGIGIRDETGIAKSADMVIAFQGEIYNSRFLRRRLLRKGVKFDSTSDAELVLKLFQLSGAEAFGNLRGSFACAIWNTLRQELILARDQFGQSTLYYCLIKGKLFFASEMKSLLPVEELPRLVDREAIVNYLLYGYVPSPKTLFLNIAKLPAASSVCFRRGILRESSRYWNLEFQPQFLDEDEAIHLVYHKILETVKLGVSRHNEFAILLSGGFDSSLLAAMTRKLTDRSTKAYTFVASGQNNTSAESIANQLDLSYHQVTMTPKDAIKIFGTLPKIYCDLIADPFISLPTYVLVRAAKHEHALFAADNADNVFWGLPMLYDQFKLMRKLQRVPGGFKKFLLHLTKRFESTYSYQRSFHNLLMASLSNKPYAYIGRIFTDQQIGKLVQTDHSMLSNNSRFDEPEKSAPTLSDFYRYNLTTAPDRPANISRIGPICRSLSLKLFEPFLDPQLVQLAAKLPTSLKQPSRNADKVVLKKIATKFELLPKDFRPRKRGLRCALDDWYAGELGEWTHQTILDELPIFISERYVTSLLKRKKFIDNIYAASQDYRTSTRDIFALLMLVMWFKEYAPEVGS